MRISDWSSDVCSSDLDNEGPWLTISAVEIGWRPWRLLVRTIDVERIELSEIALARLPAGPPEAESDEGGERKSVVSGKSVSVRVDLGGRRIIQKKNKTQ